MKYFFKKGGSNIKCIILYQLFRGNFMKIEFKYFSLSYSVGLCYRTV